MAKVIFLHLSIIHSVHRGDLPQFMLGYHPPPPPRSRPIPPHPGGRPCLGGDTPPRADTPLGANTLPREQTPPPPSRHPPGSRLQHMVYERPVRILLECIFVWPIFSQNCMKMKEIGQSERRASLAPISLGSTNGQNNKILTFLDSNFLYIIVIKGFLQSGTGHSSIITELSSKCLNEIINVTDSVVVAVGEVSCEPHWGVVIWFRGWRSWKINTHYWPMKLLTNAGYR